MFPAARRAEPVEQEALAQAPTSAVQKDSAGLLVPEQEEVEELPPVTLGGRLCGAGGGSASRLRLGVGLCVAVAIALGLFGLLASRQVVDSALRSSRPGTNLEEYSCDVGDQPKLWRPNATGDDMDVKVLTANLEWWKLYKREGGGDAVTAKLVAGTGPYDIMGFQECNDAGWALTGAGLRGTYNFFKDETTGNGGSGLCTAWLIKTWKLLEHGSEVVGEDTQKQYYGKRKAQWARFQNYDNGKFVMWVNHHGPLPVDSGGVCGGTATARNLLQVVATHGKKGDIIIMLGDFNAGAKSETVAELSKPLEHLLGGQIYGGVDNIFANTEGKNQTNLGKHGSDHADLSVVVHVVGEGFSKIPVKHEKCPEHPKCECGWASVKHCQPNGDDGSCCYRKCCEDLSKITM